MQKMYKGLENKIISLQQRIDELNKDNAKLKQRTAEIPELKTKLATHRALEADLKLHNVQLAEKTALLAEATKRAEQEHDERMAVLGGREQDQRLWEVSKQTMQTEIEILKQQLQQMVECASEEASGKF